MSTHRGQGSPVADQSAAAAGRRRRWLLAGVAVLLVAALAVLLLALDRDDAAPSATGEPAARTSGVPTEAADETVAPSPPTPEPTGPTEDVDEPPPSLPEVPLEAPAAVGNGITATLPDLEAIDGTAVGPGNIAGPALRVTVRIANGTDAAVSLYGVAVNLYYGPDRAPASPLEDPSQRPFAGMVEPGRSADGVYVFSIPADARNSVTVEVGYQAGAPLLLFTGAAP
ncbi:MAG: uncharacterized protein JWR82_2482 [Blastococcus sp.]|jgi:hypothetical protein|nr:uncharacterized protein [Blastococcus sp.]